MKNIQTYLLPAFWVDPLINSDESGLSEEDIKALNDWWDFNEPGYCIGCSSESEFTPFHDASGHVLACDRLEFTFIQDK